MTSDVPQPVSFHAAPRAASVEGTQRWAWARTALILGGLLIVGLALRLLVWRWHEQYPLGGDEREYFNQALTWLQGNGYRELPLMRPPLYTVFLAVVFRLFDSLVQRVRLIQALISTGTIALMWLWTREVFAESKGGGRVALVTAALTALCYTFAANATELLTETLFVAGLTLVFWLLQCAARRRSWRWALCAGVCVGALSLLRSVALPLVPLGCVWLLLDRRPPINDRPSSVIHRPWSVVHLPWSISVWFALGAVILIAPWTIRNYALYATPIVIDTTGAENLWLDNNPAGREAVKQQLYAMGDDRGGRQQVAMQRGIAAIKDDPGRFAAKAWGEAQKFVALEYFDGLREKRGIWVPTLEVWLRLLLGDGIWLLLLIGGTVGLWLGPNNRIKWLLVPWALYVALTGLIFHVELRYRLPLYPALLPYAGWAIVRWGGQRRTTNRRRFKYLGAIVTVAAALTLLLLHRPYISEGAMLARKHYHLWQADRALASGADQQVQQHAEAALHLDPDSALARVALGLAANDESAQRWWREAIDVLPAHPYAHLLLGNSLRRAGNLEAARRELAFEDRSLEDLQQWAINRFDREPQGFLDIGGGLDLGAIKGFYAAQDGARWTGPTATIDRLTPASTVRLRLRSPRRSAAPPATVKVRVDGMEIGGLTVGGEWQTYELSIPTWLVGPQPSLALTLNTSTFRPRAFDRASPDNRDLGVEVDWVATSAATSAP